MFACRRSIASPWVSSGRANPVHLGLPPVRLPFPERLPLFSVFLFCTVLCVLQQLDGTSVAFSVCTFAFIIVATLAFNVAGGLTRASGGYIFAFSILVAIFGIVYKVILGEPGQSNLVQPVLTLEVYIGTVAAMLGAAYLARKFTPPKNLFPNFASNSDLGRASIACCFVGTVAQLYATFSTQQAEAGSVLSALYQLDYFLPLAVILGATYEIRKSGGRRSVNAQVLIAGFLMFAQGITGYSKEGIIGPFAFWVFAAAAQRYKVNVAQIAGLVLMAAFISYYLVPYSQLGRTYRVEGATFSASLKTNIYLLSNLGLVREAYNRNEELSAEINELTFRYYDHPAGFADRLSMIVPDDTLISATETNGTFGIFPTIFAFENNIPHFLWPGKPIVNFGNVYAHEVGLLSDDTDVTTGISFSPAGDVFHQAKWVGILVMLPVLLFMLFLITDSCCGDTRESPFALLALVFFLHNASEGGVTGIIHSSTFGIVALCLLALLATKLMPVLADLVVGVVKRPESKGSVIQPEPGAFVAAAGVPALRATEVPPSAYRWSNPASGK
jgi:hypothetical protein